jgi:Ran GTPase-activating protein (RanGAP) involved in mRNA processing and transport
LVGPEVFGDVGAAIAEHPSLTSLELYGNSIDGPTAEGLVTTVSENRRIRKLNLGNNNIMADARDRIAEAAKGSSLRIVF